MTNQDYPARKGYRSAEKALEYSRRSVRRDVAEKKLLERIIREIINVEKGRKLRVLDVPCGTGRIAHFLEGLGLDVMEADIAHAMLIQGQASGNIVGRSVVADLEGGLPFPNDTFDIVLTWRFLHHLPSIDRLMDVIRETARISRKWIVFSFFHPLSLHNMTRKIHGVLTGRKGCRFAYSPSEIDHACQKSDLVFWKKKAQLPYLKDLWAAAYIKKKTGDRN